jgi:nucleotide-binding universal stress UspA family protein
MAENTTEKVIQKVLVPVDFSDITEAVVKSAKFIGEKFKPKFYLLHVISPLVYISMPETMVVDVIDAETIEEIEEIKRKNAENFLNNLAKEFEGFEVETVIDIGSPADVIVEKEELYDVDLTILGGHEKGLVERILLGSTSEAVAKHSKRPVLVIKGHALEKLQKVAIAYDFSEAADKMVEFALKFLKPFGSKVVLIHVEEEIDIPLLKKLGLNIISQIREKKSEKLAQLKERFEQNGISCEVAYIEEREPAEGILEVINNDGFDMVMLADRGLSGLKRILMGSVSLEVLRKSHIPTFIYKMRKK